MIANRPRGNIVLDVSGAAEIVAKTQNGVDIINMIFDAERVLAPDLYRAEIANVMWKIGRRDKSGANAYMDMARDCMAYIDEYANTADLWQEALREAFRLNHSVYDMLYAILAKRCDAILVTMDKSLRTVCEALFVRCAPTVGIRSKD